MKPGIRKMGRINRLCRLYDQKQIPYKRKDIEKMSLGELTHAIEKIAGKGRPSKWRAGDNN